MSIKAIFKGFFVNLFKIEPKKKLNPGVIGFYDCRSFDSFEYSLYYVNSNKLIDTKELKLFSREYKGTTFIDVLVFDEESFDIKNYTYEALKPLLVEKGITPTDRSTVLVLFQHKNDNTINMCKKFCNSDKNNFEQGCVYNAKEVIMEYFKPVPVFYSHLYGHFCENLYFDLAFFDSTRS